VRAHKPLGTTPISRIVSPFLRFARLEAASGVLLLLASAAALILANSPWSGAWAALWHADITVGLGGRLFTRPVEFWINDGLMTVFFFVVGLEIKREILVGELSSPRKAVLPAAAALGGMAAPAAIYALLNLGGPGAPGWAIPMATDIAFALGVLALVGAAVPAGLKVFLAALAIVDDLGAVLVIAIFYTERIWWPALGAGALVLGVLAAANLLGVRRPLPYALLGVVLWAAMLSSGVHATLTGVLLALTLPARARIDTGRFLRICAEALRQFRAAGPSREDEPTNEGHHAALAALEDASEAVQTPLQRLERLLHGWVVFAIMPLFALANAGVRLEGAAGFGKPAAVGVLLGLVVGKPLGILLLSWAAVRLGIADLPKGVAWTHLAGAGMLAGIGFTMSLFVAGLAFGATPLLDQAKLGILGASAFSGVAGGITLRRALRPGMPKGA